MKKIHMMGVLGSGMSGVASLASKMGYEVSGCDLKTTGHSKDHLKNMDLLIVSPAVLFQNKSNPELNSGLKKKIVMTWEEFVGKELTKNKKVIAVAGTHGKSTTTAMVAKILIDNGFDPSVIVGANVPEWGGNSRYGKGKYFVIEADEFNDNFLNYNPDIAVINNIEFDHPDYFKNEKQLRDSFDKFTQKLVGQKILITENESLNKKFKLKVMGEHNQKNANMAFLVGNALNIPDEKITKSIESFIGIRRRMELIKDGNTKIYDDYAHHPTAIKTTLEGLRKKYPNQKILTIIEPHGYKRTKALLPLYKNAFDSADEVLIGPIFKARDKVDKSITINDLVKVSDHKNIKAFESVAELIENCKLRIDNYDVVVVMGAGNSSNWAQRIADALHGQAKKSFKELTTLKTGGVIKYFFEVKDKKELVKAVSFAKLNKLPIFIIGGGTDIAVSDSEFNGVVIKYIGEKLKIKNLKLKIEITAEAGILWDDLVKISVDKGLSGIECLSGIPGTVGAAPIQNIGAYGQELKDTFVSLTAYDIENEKFVKFDIKTCQFEYRDSFFKKKENWQKFIITDITLKLKGWVDKDLELQTIRNEILRVRGEKLVDPNEVPNAGSFFKNPIVSREKKMELENKFPELRSYEYGKNFKLSAGWIIENTGWKGKALGPVAVSEKHALVITNPEGKGTLKDVKTLADKIIKDVEARFGITLEPEVQYINT